ncbi:hypothetical protein HPB52_017440 [Rhipicephalus sanguineus]|uniref:PDZ domain-containing protein n=1 Tax=Rhipicephalus sanguineus TaxID=34632 RepID=A0A9D4T0X9_RHISA|nr:hypothetical protein HPB52_017440 [Rhipicephalus sanguineus]
MLVGGGMSSPKVSKKHGKRHHHHRRHHHHGHSSVLASLETSQTYGIHHKRDGEIELITYVDYVEYDGPAFRAGMRPGDVILSINGHDMEHVDHKSLVRFIQGCASTMRMVVLFEDCVHKVELHIRYLRLQRVLQDKITELKGLCEKEQQLLESWRERGIHVPSVVTCNGTQQPRDSSSHSSWQREDDALTSATRILSSSLWNRHSFKISSMRSDRSFNQLAPTVIEGVLLGGASLLHFFQNFDFRRQIERSGKFSNLYDACITGLAAKAICDAPQGLFGSCPSSGIA